MRHENNMQTTRALWLFLFTCAGAIILAVGCSRTQVRVPAPLGTPRKDNSYIDLQAGWTLRIVVPLLKSGGFVADWVPQKTEGKTLTLSAPDLVGYTTSHYAVTGKDGNVRLNFVSAEETRDGKTAPVAVAPQLPFELPRKSERVRLVYLVRVSQADHNMAIVGAKRLEDLNAFTNRLKEDPSVCHAGAAIFCSWVPAGVAVRTETGEGSARGSS